MLKQQPRWHSAGTFVAALVLVLVLLAPTSAAAQQDDSGVPTALDPCQLVTPSEAASLAGAVYASGTEVTNDSGSTMCIYGSQTVNVFEVLVAQAPDAATAQADWSDEEANAQALLQSGPGLPPGVSVHFDLTDVLDLAGADRAAVAQGGASFAGRSISASACYLLKGATFIAFSDLQVGPSAPSSDAMKAQAATVLSRLP